MIQGGQSDFSALVRGKFPACALGVNGKWDRKTKEDKIDVDSMAVKLSNWLQCFVFTAWRVWCDVPDVIMF